MRIVLVSLAAALATAGLLMPAASGAGALDNAGAALDFDYARAVNVTSTAFSSSTSPTLAQARCTTDESVNCVGKNVGDTVRFIDVATIDGQSVDALVTTTALAANTRIRYYEVRSSYPQWTANPGYFWVNLGRTGGDGSLEAAFDIAFVQSGSDLPVTLEDVNVSGDEIDNRQYLELTGTDSYTLSDPTQLKASSPSPGVVRFTGPSSNSDAATAPEHRVVANYAALSRSTVTVGRPAGSASNATYGVAFTTLAFGEYPTTTTVTETGEQDTTETPEDRPVVVDPSEEIEPPRGEEWDTGSIEVIDPGTGRPSDEVTTPEGTWEVDRETGHVTFTPEPGFEGDAEISVEITSTDGSVTEVVEEWVTVGERTPQVPQEPARPLDLPAQVEPGMLTSVAPSDVRTDAGELIRVRITCAPRQRTAQAGDAEACTVVRSNGRVWVRAASGTDVTVTLSARGDDSHLPFRVTAIYHVAR